MNLLNNIIIDNIYKKLYSNSMFIHPNTQLFIS